MMPKVFSNEKGVLHFEDGDGNIVPVSKDNKLPMKGDNDG